MPDQGRVWNAWFPKSSKQDKGLPNWDNSSAAWRQGNGLNDLSRPRPAPKSVCTLPSRWLSLPFPPKHLLKKERHVVALIYRNWDKPRLGPAPERKQSATAGWGPGAFLFPLPFPLPWRLPPQVCKAGIGRPTYLQRLWAGWLPGLGSLHFFDPFQGILFKTPWAKKLDTYWLEVLPYYKLLLFFFFLKAIVFIFQNRKSFIFFSDYTSNTCLLV